MVLTACNKKIECKEPIYPTLSAIGKIPTIHVVVKDGKLSQESTQKAFKGIRALRVTEHYYYNLLTDYQKTFGDKNGTK